MSGAGSMSDVGQMNFPPEGITVECNRPQTLQIFLIWFIRLVGLAMMAGGGFVSEFPMVMRIASVCAGVGLWVGIEAYARQLRRKRFWLTWHTDWFVVRTRSGEQTYRQDQIIGTSLALKDKTVDQKANLIATRHYYVWVNEDAKPIQFIDRLHSAKPDLLQPFVEYTEKRFSEKSESILAAGGNIVGGNPPNDWTLTQRMLVLHHGDNGQVLEVPFASLADVALTDGHVCIWRKGDSRPFFRVSESSINAIVLLNWLAKQLPEDASEEPDVNRPGRLIFERKPDKRIPFFLYVVSVLVILPGIVFAVIDPKLFLAIPLSIVIGLFLAFVGWVISRQGFECYENKLRQRQFAHFKELEYREIEHFTCQITHNFVNGGYTGTLFRMVMEPFHASGKGKITYGCTIKAFDKTLESLRDHIAVLVMLRMKQDLESGGSVAWTPGVTFMPEGLHRAKKMFNKEVFLPYDQILGFNMQQGTFFVFAKGSDKPVLSMQTSERNFFPGMYLIGRLTSDEDVAEADSPDALDRSETPPLPHEHRQAGQDAGFGPNHWDDDDQFGQLGS